MLLIQQLLMAIAGFKSATFKKYLTRRNRPSCQTELRIQGRARIGAYATWA
jgi:hypothetical protein